ncbi:hypothetical protein ASPCADRAFT_211454 [Aspergillus carbonarius ITEM 5010]|uniref:Uncharacterized protein n=1 Tax=Aspergillus carbonarius (strain ITEM 5010) TaxID=602072 RepID=A0A1R3R9M7_ASPC5|nr:hypothetical protein ASPCADRAFT_211454 [Aspergillus carbonarius ITEM 5010]
MFTYWYPIVTTRDIWGRRSYHGTCEELLRQSIELLELSLQQGMILYFYALVGFCFPHRSRQAADEIANDCSSQSRLTIKHQITLTNSELEHTSRRATERMFSNPDG